MEVVELSLNIVVGISNPDTLKVRGNNETEEVVVLVDCRATYNFIAPRVVEELKLPLAELDSPRKRDL